MMRFKGRCTAALIVAAMALAGCGGDGGDGSPQAAATATGATGASDSAPASSKKEPSTRADRKRDRAAAGVGSGSGGSSAPPSSADDSGAGGGEDVSEGRGEGPDSRGKSKPEPKRSGPARGIEDLSADERKKLHADLYEQGRALCRTYGPVELAKSFDLPTTDFQQLAQLYAEKYEQATPSLILPVAQGCLSGLKQWRKKNG